MTTDERDKLEYRKNNRNYLGLTDEQCDLHREIMGKAMSLWPESLTDYCKSQASVSGVCGDAIACWVAEWIKQGNTLEDPFANETDDEFNAGCNEALKALGCTPIADTPGMDLTEFVKSGIPDASQPYPKAIRDALNNQYEQARNKKKQ